MIIVSNNVSSGYITLNDKLTSMINGVLTKN